ncbi:monovalent cation/H+ antiporter subunit D [Halovivax asiaticus JCM 14624]|uniref:Monovalent cation/H+ antiporter subunit D n=1 Tax=Halovivax asiaticus JCM 14624 TaxID=1227490 RepID=M0BVQ4_9EURY|nr:monovalent cation/H+ antiporter subunit D family protein [Halovivax asiaticus]ELZ14197.1 monovalent cation/H+ antiporter subunit D [Halovivax asiaticus JCM 14624]
MPVDSILPLLAVAIPAIAIPLILALGRRPNVREGVTLTAAFATFATVASMVPDVLDGAVYETDLGTFLSTGLGDPIGFTLQADRLGVLFALLASFLWIATSFYSIGYMRGLDEHDQTRFFAAFAASIASAMGVAFGANLVTLFVFYEVLSIATYPLVAHDESEEAIWAGRKYLLYTLGGGVAVLAGTVMVYAMTGTTTFQAGGIAALTEDPMMARAAFALLVGGFGVKAALMPFHSWLPDAMVAPTPVSALLHAVAVVKSGVFGIARVVLEVYGPGAVQDLGVGIALATVAAITLVTASIIALKQDNLKRRLAYSTVSQLSYIVLGLGLASPAALVGALLHIPAHAFMKITLFFCAGAIHVETHTDDISDMAGIGKRMPLTMSAFAVAAAGMAGMPLLAGFVSKWYLLVGAVELDLAIFAVVLLVSGVLNVAYYWPIVYQAFFEDEHHPDPKPLLEFPPGGLASSDTGVEANSPRTNGGRHLATTAEPTGAAVDADADGPDSVRSDGDGDHEESVTDTDVTDDHVSSHGGGHTADSGWERRSWRTESTWFMLGPIVLAAVGAVVLGLVPGHVVFLELIEHIVDVATEVTH